MKRKQHSNSNTHPQAVLLTLETFLAMTDMPHSQRQDCGGQRLNDAKGDAPEQPQRSRRLRQLGQYKIAAAQQPC